MEECLRNREYPLHRLEEPSRDRILLMFGRPDTQANPPPVTGEINERIKMALSEGTHLDLN